MRLFNGIITPEEAKIFLKYNTSNRKMIRLRVLYYEEQIRTGRWQNNGEPILIKKNGELLDGQHRLKAIANTGIPTVMTIIYDIDDDVTVTDRGCNKTEVQILGGKRNARELAMANTLYDDHLIYTKKTGTSRLGAEQKDEVCEKFEQFMKIAMEVTEIKKQKGAVKLHNASIQTAVVYALYNGMELDDVRGFMKIAKSGFYDGDPSKTSAIVFREMLIKNMVISSSRTDRQELKNVAIRALKDYKEKRPRTQQYKPTNALTKEEFVFHEDHVEFFKKLRGDTNDNVS